MGYITPQRIIDLKAKVKAECQRRRYTGRIDNTYGSATYDFTTVPTAGGGTETKRMAARFSVQRFAV